MQKSSRNVPVQSFFVVYKYTYQKNLLWMRRPFCNVFFETSFFFNLLAVEIRIKRLQFQFFSSLKPLNFICAVIIFEMDDGFVKE